MTRCVGLTGEAHAFDASSKYAGAGGLREREIPIPESEIPRHGRRIYADECRVLRQARSEIFVPCRESGVQSLMPTPESWSLCPRGERWEAILCCRNSMAIPSHNLFDFTTCLKSRNSRREIRESDLWELLPQTHFPHFSEILFVFQVTKIISWCRPQLPSCNSARNTFRFPYPEWLETTTPL